MATTQIPSTMKAWVLEEFKTPYQLRDVPTPTIEDPNDLLIRIEACSYCHTDAVLVEGTISPPTLPFIGGHEFAGTVVGLPSGKEKDDDCHGYHLGDRVAIPGRGNHVCGQCRECQNPSPPLADPPGFSVFCPHSGAGLGVDQSGGFREYAIVDARQIALIPDGLTATDVAPLMCAGLTIFSALAKCELIAGQRVGIMGCGGGLGHLGLQFATKMGLKTTGVDVAPAGLSLAQELQTGATIVDASKVAAKDVKQKMGEEDGWKLPSEMGLDAVIILPETQKAFDYALELVRNGGRAVLVSFPSDGFHVSALDLVFRRIKLEGTLIGSNRAMRDMFDFVKRHGVRATKSEYAFEKLNELVQDYQKGTPGKLVLKMNASG